MSHTINAQEVLAKIEAIPICDGGKRAVKDLIQSITGVDLTPKPKAVPRAGDRYVYVNGQEVQTLIDVTPMYNALMKDDFLSDTRWWVWGGCHGNQNKVYSGKPISTEAMAESLDKAYKKVE